LVAIFVKKRSLKILPRSPRSTFETTKQIYRPRLYYESGCVHCRLQSSTLGSAYGDTTAVTSCSQYAKSSFLL